MTHKLPTFVDIMCELRKVRNSSTHLNHFLKDYVAWLNNDEKLGVRVACTGSIAELKIKQQQLSHTKQNLLLQYNDSLRKQAQTEYPSHLANLCIPDNQAREFNPTIILANRDWFSDETTTLVASDLHGSFSDAAALIQLFLMHLHAGEKYKLVFLGDYIDRGRNSLETLLLIMILQRHLPQHVIMLRGNHETYSQCMIQHDNELYPTLSKELIKHYGKDLGKSLLRNFCLFFGALPVCIISANWDLLMLHGGIPLEGSISDITYTLKQAADFLNVVNIYHYLWSDCAHNERNRRYVNGTRGGGAYRFSEDQLKLPGFMMDFQIIRGHTHQAKLNSTPHIKRVHTVTTAGNKHSQTAAKYFHSEHSDSFIAVIQGSRQIELRNICIGEKNILAMRLAELLLYNLADEISIDKNGNTLVIELFAYWANYPVMHGLVTDLRNLYFKADLTESDDPPSWKITIDSLDKEFLQQYEETINSPIELKQYLPECSIF